MLIEQDVTVARPKGQVFAALADLRNAPAFDPHVTEVELMSGEPVGQDSRFTMVVNGERYDVGLRRHQPPHLLEISGTGRLLRFRHNFALLDGAAGTLLIGRFELHARGLRRLLAPIQIRAFRREAADWLRALKLYCEAQP